ncbi:M23 family metallopeptidase [Corynebacterium bovis]|uniref:M23 family metallopeptidase n=1 Tax=Corynebacterium bovis TaxID=36808 RepID=UPI00254AD4AE|nr:M23 family metallopeptidase [Corynebacterium bovis]MDK8511720.1 M23 family metallopeptidase [Corynebacterium bovis]
MQSSTGVRYVGTHRKQDTTAKRRVALFAVAASAVTTAGAAGATAGNSQGQDNRSGGIALASDNTVLAQGDDTGSPAGDVTGSLGSSDSAPQILEVPQAKPVTGLSDQLSSALQFNAARAAADLASRAPLIIKPAKGAFTSGFEIRWGTMHKGVDIANSTGTPILAVEDGEVIDAGPASGFGQWVRIRHDDGTVTVYGHMETIDVSVGQHVTAGQKIAGMGSRGFSTGTHLHFEVHPNGGDAIDPLPWLAARGISL